VSLSTKIPLILLVVVALYIGLEYTVQHRVILPSFEALERDEARKDMQRAVAALQRELSQLNQRCFEYASWDETYRFIGDLNADYIASNLAATSFTNNHVDLIYIVGLEGEVTWGRCYKTGSGKEIQLVGLPRNRLSTGHPLLEHAGDPRPLSAVSVTGILRTERGPMLIVSRPILTSASVGPARGAMIMGRFLTDEVLATVAERAQVTLDTRAILRSSTQPSWAETGTRLYNLDEELLFEERSARTLSVYTTLYDILGDPVLLVRLDIPRVITAKGAASMRFAMLSIMAAGSILLLVLLLLLQMAVIGPVARLTEHAITVGKTAALSERLDIDRSNELGTLARELDRMMHQLDQARTQLLEQTFRAGMAEMAAGVLHNVRNALSPIATQIDTLCLELQELPLDQMSGAQAELTSEEVTPGRRKDLSHFLDLAHQRLATLVPGLQAQLAEVRTRMSQVEEILAVQERFSHAERPLERLYVEDMVRDALALVPDDLRQRMTVEIDPGVASAGRLLANRVSLLQVLAALLTNAAEATVRHAQEQGQVKVSATTELSDQEMMIHLQICDNGAGVEPAHLEEIFKRGYSTKKGSSGLGLHWSANVINAMRGRLHAESQGPGQGTCMHLLLPGERRGAG
jgi:sensor domain CHASE-containing protein